MIALWSVGHCYHKITPYHHVAYIKVIEFTFIQKLGQILLHLVQYVWLQPVCKIRSRLVAWGEL